MNKKNGQKKLLAAVAVFAMVACVFAAVPMVAEDDVAVGATLPAADDAGVIDLVDDVEVTSWDSTGITEIDLNGFTLTINATSVVFEDLSITSSKPGAELVCIGAAMQTLGDVSISDVSVKSDFPHVFTNDTRGSDLSITDCIFEGGQTIVYINGKSTSNVTLDGCITNGGLVNYHKIDANAEPVTITECDYLVIGFPIDPKDDADADTITWGTDVIVDELTPVYNVVSYGKNVLIPAGVTLETEYIKNFSGNEITVTVAGTLEVTRGMVNVTPDIDGEGSLIAPTTATTPEDIKNATEGTFFYDNVGTDVLEINKNVVVNVNLKSSNIDATGGFDVSNGGVASIEATDASFIVKTASSGEDAIKFINVTGNFAVENGSVKITGTDIAAGTIELPDGETLEIDIDVLDDFVITVATGGTAKVKVIDDLEITGTLTISEGIKMTNEAMIELDYGFIEVAETSILINEGTIDGIGEISGDGTFELKSKGVVYTGVEIKTDNVVGSLEDAELSGSTGGSITFPVYQNVIVPEGKTLTINAGHVITILGNLDVLGDVVILNGGELIIGMDGYQKATADFAGIVEVQDGAYLTIGNADVVLDGALNVEGVVELYNESTITVNDDSVFSKAATIETYDYAYIVVGSGATLTIEGYLDAYILVNGNLVIDNGACEVRAGDYNYVYVDLVAEGASVTVKSFLFEDEDAGIYISDYGLQLAKVDKVSYTVKSDTMNDVWIDIYDDVKPVVIPKAGVILKGDLIVTSVIEKSTDSNGVTTVENILDVSGDLSNGTTLDKTETIVPVINVTMTGQDETPEPIVTNYVADGRVQIPAQTILNVDKGVKVLVDGEIVVAGYLDMTKKDVLPLVIDDSIYTSEDASVLVTGTIKTNAPGILASQFITAASFVTEEDEINYYVYTNFVSAVADVLADTNLNKDKIVTILGDITVTESVDVLAPVVVVVNDGNKLYIGDDDDRTITVTMKNGASMESYEATVDVKASLLFEEKTDDETDETLSDVTVEDLEAKNGSRLYTNIYSAMEKAVAGDIVKVTRAAGTNVELTSDLIVKEGVTLYVPEDAASLWLANGVTLTVDGTLTSEEDVLAQHVFANVAMIKPVDNIYTSAIIVNGTLMTPNGFAYANGNEGDDDADPVTYAELSKGAPIAGAYYQTEDYYVVSTLEIAIFNIADVENDIIINGPVIAGDVPFIGSEEYTCKEIVISGTIVDDATGVDIVTSLTVGTATLQGIDLVVNENGEINGTFTAREDSVVLSKVVGGAVVVGTTNPFTMTETDDGLVVTGAAVLTTDGAADPKELSSFVVSAGTVEFGAAAAFTYTGTLTIDAAADLVNVNGVTEILINGTANVGEDMVAKNVATMTVMGTLEVFAGTDSKAQSTLEVTYLDVGIEYEDFLATAAAAVVNGPVAVGKYAVVLAGSAVDDVAMKGLGENFTEFYVDGVLWITVYDCDNSDPSITTIGDAPVEDAYVSGWLDETGKLIDSTNDKKIGENGAKKVTAAIEYDIYNIQLLANEGIADISIDGNLMKYGAILDSNTSNGYAIGYSAVVAAGEHKIEYTLKNGYSGEAVLTVNGVTVSGMTFTTEGTPVDDKGITYELQLSGIEKSGYSEPTSSGDSGMSLTDILLIVLVVLVVVMAALVAMRMMRS